MTKTIVILMLIGSSGSASWQKQLAAFEDLPACAVARDALLKFNKNRDETFICFDKAIQPHE